MACFCAGKAIFPFFVGRGVFVKNTVESSEIICYNKVYDSIFYRFKGEVLWQR